MALAFAVRHPDIDLRAVTTVSGDAVKRAYIARKLVDIAGRNDIEVAAGIGGTAPRATRSPWSGHEGEGLLEAGEEFRISERDAVSLLLDECTRGESGCEIATVGMQTNVAAALERDTSLADRVRRLAVMGGVFGPIRDRGRTLPPAEADHNLNCDPEAAVRALNVGIPTLYVPGNVTFQAELTLDQVDYLRSGDALCRALARLLDVHVALGHRHADNRAALLHDPLTVACTVDRRFVRSEEIPVTVAVLDGHIRTFVDPLEGHVAEVVSSVDGEAFSRFWLETVLA